MRKVLSVRFDGLRATSRQPTAQRHTHKESYNTRTTESDQVLSVKKIRSHELLPASGAARQRPQASATSWFQRLGDCNIVLTKSCGRVAKHSASLPCTPSNLCLSTEYSVHSSFFEFCSGMLTGHHNSLQYDGEDLLQPR